MTDITASFVYCNIFLMDQVYYFALIYPILCALYATFSEFMKTTLCCKLSSKILRSFVQSKTNLYWIAVVFPEIQKSCGLLRVY